MFDLEFYYFLNNTKHAAIGHAPTAMGEAIVNLHTIIIIPYN